MSAPSSSPAPRRLLLALLLAACGGAEGRETAGQTVTGASNSSSSSEIATDSATTTTGAPTTGPATTSTSTSTTSGSTGTDPGTGGSSTSGLKLDVGSDTGGVCPPDDICCLQPGDIPPHTLLDEFLAAYPAAAMPKTVADVQAFEPMAGGHAMAWSDENVGNELVDANNGGVIEPNIVAGRALARAAAELAIPADATILEAREDPVVIEDLGTPAPCIGVGWAWGSLLFQGVDQSIGEVVYLYVGYCSSGDVEVFYYSDQAVEICPPPG